jgi:hypothetical protein
VDTAVAPPPHHAIAWLPSAFDRDGRRSSMIVASSLHNYDPSRKPG